MTFESKRKSKLAKREKRVQSSNKFSYHLILYREVDNNKKGTKIIFASIKNASKRTLVESPQMQIVSTIGLADKVDSTFPSDTYSPCESFNKSFFRSKEKTTFKFFFLSFVF